MNFKEIHIGQMIEKRVAESGMETSRICSFLKCSKEEIEKMFTKENLSTDILLKWSNLLDYDFFRVYTQHLILYAPLSAVDEKIKVKKNLLYLSSEKTSTPKKL